MRDPEAENRELRAQIATLIEAAGKNERLLKRNQERELEILRAETLPQLFDVICKRLRESYALDAVTLVLADPQHEIRHLLLGEQIRLEKFPEVIFTDSVIGMAPQFHALLTPWLGPYMGPDHHLLFRGPHALKSIALIPLRRQEKLHGCLAFGSCDERRFNRHLATDFLAHLGVMVSFAVEHAINRARLVRSGLTDFLTGWHNRRYLQARLMEELARARRQGTSLVCLLIDLDRFKEINDEHGHLAGDLALREVALRIDGQIRSSDAAARYGGDEFVVLLPGATLEQARGLAERVRAAVAAAAVEVADGVEKKLTVSIGMGAVAPAKEQLDLKGVAERLFSNADAALYRAKQGGRNRVEAEPA
jgi:two-component system, cell cycle response regulator